MNAGASKAMKTVSRSEPIGESEQVTRLGTPLSSHVDQLGLTAKAAAAMLNVSPSHFYALQRTGQLPKPIRL